MNKDFLTIVYDNRLYDENLKSGWGFSCLVEHLDKKILFDTGNDSNKLSFNLENLKIEPKDLDAVVLSHSHWDHTGGLDGIVEKGIKSTVYFGGAFPENFKQGLREKGIKFIEISEINKIAEGVFVGPQMGGFGPKEVPLTIETDKGLVIITGCAHPGISNIITEINKIFSKKIYLVLGGFHLEFSLALKKIIKEFKKLGIQKVGPCHCTGERAINLFREEFGEDFIRVGAGLRIEI